MTHGPCSRCMLEPREPAWTVCVRCRVALAAEADALDGELRAARAATSDRAADVVAHYRLGALEAQHLDELGAAHDTEARAAKRWLAAQEALAAAVDAPAMPGAAVAVLSRPCARISAITQEAPRPTGDGSEGPSVGPGGP